jgi:signal transduction histidine kinase
MTLLVNVADWKSDEDNPILCHVGADGTLGGPLIADARAEPNGVLVSVRDTGPGLAPATAERLFQPF